MQLDHSILIILLNLGLLLAFSWLGFQLFKTYVACDKKDLGGSQKENISGELLFPCFYKRYLIVKRMIKTDSDDDTAPYPASSFLC